jgi:hypothetical protein
MTRGAIIAVRGMPWRLRAPSRYSRPIKSSTISTTMTTPSTPLGA